MIGSGISHGCLDGLLNGLTADRPTVGCRVVTKQTDTNRRICLFDRRTIFVCLSGSPERPSLSVWFVSRIYLPKKVRDQYKVQVAEKTIDRRSISDLPQTMNADPDMPRQALLACYDGAH